MWEEIGVVPAALTTSIAGRPDVSGFKRCGGIDRWRTYAINVWSQSRTVDDFRRKERRIEFYPTSIAERTAYRYQPGSDHSGDRCCLLFPTSQGSCTIDVLRISPESLVSPTDRAIRVSRVLVRVLPE
ncbi:hypothetical protein NRB20_69720 [Nocardia sp. RB20]|uniref:Uncharacterized protein n=1 Tax=Nocardia macrotermitis TaxID=2585198 RepID=A0A7K0DDY8_9NOCA|nr:hypothetical protein [Nocardia macrotermitis]